MMSNLQDKKIKMKLKFWMTTTCKPGDKLVSKQAGFLELFVRKIKLINIRLSVLLKF